MIEQEIKIINKLGLHARASAKLVSTAARFSSRVEVIFGPHTADAKSIMSVMMLAASVGSVVTLRTDGEDQNAAMDAMKSLINNYFEEQE
jgi:phosphocarrier protein